MSAECEDDLVQQRLEVLALAEQLGNVRQACQQLGVPRSQFYKYKRRYKE